MLEPIDDLDPALDERESRKWASATCSCGRAKRPGTRKCAECEDEDMMEMARLNPPYMESD